MRHSGSRTGGTRRAGGGWVLLIGVLLLFGNPCRAAHPNYFTRIWQTDDGLPANGVSAIVQGGEGYLWLGTYSGLARFDGVRFKVFNSTTTPEMFSSRVTALFEDSTGTLWIGFETGGLMRYRGGMFQGGDASVWNGSRVLAIAEDRVGDIWGLSVSGMLLRVRDGLVLTIGGGGESELGSLVRDDSGEMWVLWNGRLYLLDQNRLQPAVFPDGTTNDFVQGITQARSGGLWIARNGKVRRWMSSSWVSDVLTAPWGRYAATSAFLETRSWGLAAGVVDRGLDFLGGDNTSFLISRTNGLPSNWIRSLFEDREGNLWMGTGNGLTAMRVSKVAAINPPDMWQDRAVLSVTSSRDGSLWAGTEGAGLYRFDGSAWAHFGTAEGLSNSFVWAVSEDPAGRLWTGTWGGGLFWRNGNSFERPPGFEDVTRPFVSVFHSADGSTWVGTETGLAHWRDGKVTWYGRKSGLVFPDVRAIVEDSKGSVWFGMLGGGLGVVRDDRVRQFRKFNGLSSDFVQCLRVQRDGTLWIGTAGGGLNRLRRGRFATIHTTEGLPSDVICSIEDDEHGNFWISSHAGLFRVRQDLLNQCADGLTNSVHCLSYGKGDGLPTLEFSGGFQPSDCKTPDGRLWFPTSRGLIGVDPKEGNLNHLPPPVIVEDVVVDGRSAPVVSTEKPVRIPPGSGRIEIRYTGLSFVAPEKVRFRHMLEGLDRDWTDAGTNRTASYPYVPPGEYAFRVVACNNDDIWNESGQTLTVVMLPHFWQTWWFRTSAAVAIGGAIAWGVWFETGRRLQWKVERLERQRAVERERARIAKDIHDDLGASLTRITLLSQSAKSDLEHPAVAAVELDRIYGTARELTRALDEIVWAVNPQHDTLDSLASYLARYAQDYLAAANVSCRLDFSMQLPAWPLTAEVRHNLFLAFKEALNNVVKHSGATEVRVKLTLLAAAFTIDVEDNGRGFAEPRGIDGSTAGRLAGGNGLANVRRRLSEIGGRCEIRTAPGQGTGVHFVVPAAPATSGTNDEPGAGPGGRRDGKDIREH